MIRIIVRILVALVLAAALAWAALALWFDGPKSRPLAGALVAGLIASAVACVVLLRPWRRVSAALGVLFLAVLAWWFSLSPRNDRDWLADVARPPTAELRGDLLTVHNVRNFDYRSESDYTAHWEERTFDLSRLRGLDLFLSFWGPTNIAHTIMSWDFDDGQHLAISIETRKEKGEDYSAVRGFFRQYEVYYVAADERDLVGLRTNHRGEQVYLYRLAAPPETARALLLAYVEQANRVAATPAWYNALTHNCTTTIRIHVQQAGVHNPWNWRLLLNGYADELLYMRGLVNTTMPFADLKARSNVTDAARAAGDSADFSARIREQVPPRPLPPGPA